MTASKMTAGPWEAVRVTQDGNHVQWDIEPHIASVFYVTETGAANARAIALVPDMVEALEAALMDLPPTSSAYQDAQAVLAKVRGE